MPVVRIGTSPLIRSNAQPFNIVEALPPAQPYAMQVRAKYRECRMARCVSLAPLGTSTVRHVTKVCRDIPKVNRGSSIVRLGSHTPSFPTSAQSCSVRCFLVLILFPMLDSFLVPDLLSHFSASGPVELLRYPATTYD